MYKRQTNDGWWKNTAGYRQHFTYSRLRAIEQRKAIIRSANTGISGVIDKKGEVLQQTKWNEKNNWINWGKEKNISIISWPDLPEMAIPFLKDKNLKNMLCFPVNHQFDLTKIIS